MRNIQISKYKIRNLHSGFSFIELLVSMMVIMVVGSLILVVFFAALRGTGKASALLAMRQNGNYAISQMAKTIRNAQSLAVTETCPLTSSQRIQLQALDDGVITYACDDTTHNIASQSSYTTTTNFFDTTQVSLKPNTCAFSCTQYAGSNPTITIQFTLQRVNSSTLPEKNAPEVNFSTTVLMRNTAE